MIKLTLTVDYENVSKEDLVRALNANSAYECIDEIKSRFRNMNKYGSLDNKELTEEQMEFVALFEKEFLEIIEDLPEQF